jgi:glutamate--cysteine ligase
MNFSDYKGYIKIIRGIEKECLRSDFGKVSTKPHSDKVGKALTHSFITTDFSESLLEFITPPLESTDECLSFLEKLHIYTQEKFHDEVLWPNSIPCELEDDNMPLALYGSSNIGRLKTLYRSGLSYRYGRRMQMVAGIHYNISFGESLVKKLWKERGSKQSYTKFKSQMYFDTIRNYRKYFWMLIYLFGASPVIDKSFVGNRPHALDELDESSLYLEHATCLRMGGLGYQSNSQDSIYICYNDLDHYIETLNDALTASHEPYSKIGNKVGDEYRQINDFLLQIENEYYSLIRPKMPINPLERPLSALKSRGVEYLELRLFDLDPFSPIGISKQQTDFTDLFMLFCLLSESEKHDPIQCRSFDQNQKLVVEQGRLPGLEIWEYDKKRDMKDWANELLSKIKAMAVDLELDSSSVDLQKKKFNDVSLTPSAKLLAEIKREDQTFLEYTRTKARENRALFLNKSLSDSDREMLDKEVSLSIQKQLNEEQSDTKSFDDFLIDYQRDFL